MRLRGVPAVTPLAVRSLRSRPCRRGRPRIPIGRRIRRIVAAFAAVPARRSVRLPHRRTGHGVGSAPPWSAATVAGPAATAAAAGTSWWTAVGAPVRCASTTTTRATWCGRLPRRPRRPCVAIWRIGLPKSRIGRIGRGRRHHCRIGPDLEWHCHPAGLDGGPILDGAPLLQSAPSDNDVQTGPTRERIRFGSSVRGSGAPGPATIVAGR